MSYDELLRKFNEGVVDIQWKLLNCRDIYRLNHLAMMLRKHAESCENLASQMVKELENG
jgi:hypothetical protein